ncbi:helix-turn-helix domain-containing protein [Pseudomonas silesiensis]|uniref:helix-turn-helix domain-containing protein n=1 Tax=Pseudomonas silesiensis TaxID=1853130 RepID=UPI001F01BDEF|nr:helix-turn-helix transcriptional regulator [Pseudomonas silesiensis]
MSRSHFSRAFKKATGHSPRDWFQLARLTRAKELLEQTDFSITQVGMECGFADQPHFTKIFSRKFGMPPGKWRAKEKPQRKRPPNTPGVIKRTPTCAATARKSHSPAASAGV